MTSRSAEKYRFHSDNFSTKPGVYIMQDAEGAVLYVGKASNLRNRLRNYFSKTADTRPQVRFLLQRISHIDTIVTDTAKEALILENTLIKKHRPRYNIHLRDDKTYVSLRLDPQEEGRGALRTSGLDVPGRAAVRRNTPVNPNVRIQRRRTTHHAVEVALV